MEHLATRNGLHNGSLLAGRSGEARDVANQVGPQGIPVIRDALLAHIKEKALNGSRG